MKVGTHSSMKNTLLILLLGSSLLTTALAEAPSKPETVRHTAGSVAQAQVNEATFSPLQSNEGTTDNIQFTIEEGQDFATTTLIFTPPAGVDWSEVGEGGSYWLRLQRVDGGHASAAGVRVQPKDGKITSSGWPFELLLQELKDEPRPLQLVVECSVSRYATKGSESEELGVCEPITLTVR